MSDRTKTFAQFLSRYQALTGTETMTAELTEVATQAFSAAMRHGWEAYNWPWADVTEVRTLDVNNRIAYAQTSKNRIAEVFAVYNDDPQSSQGAYQISYTLDATGILFGGSNIPATAYVYYRRDCPEYYGAAYAGGTTYAVGDQVYYSTTGDFYVNIAASTGVAPTDATKWTRLTIPWDLFEYAVYQSAADLLTTNGQNGGSGRASTLYGQANDHLLTAIEKYSRQQSFRPNKQTFFTHGTQQLRNQ